MGLLKRGLSNLKKDPLVSILTIFRGVINNIKDKRIAKSIAIRKEELLRNSDKLFGVNSDFEAYIEYIKRNDISTFNSDFEREYQNNICVDIHKDGLYKYVNHFNKKLYFPWYYKFTEISKIYKTLLMEQDIDSPHKYIDCEDNLNNCIFFDCGSAEASLPLEIVDKVKKLYLFEADKKWIKPLSKTFAPWKDKVIIENKYVSNCDSNTAISLGNYIRKLVIEEQVNLEVDNIFIKMDIEGFEEIVFADIISLLKEAKNMHIAVCAYHKKDAEKNIVNMLPENYAAKARNGYMLFLYQEDGFEFPYFRRGVLRIERS